MANLIKMMNGWLRLKGIQGHRLKAKKKPPLLHRVMLAAIGLVVAVCLVKAYFVYAGDPNIFTDNVGIGTSVPQTPLDVQGAVTVGINDTGYDVKFYGTTSAKYLLWDESADTLIVSGDTYLGGTNTAIHGINTAAVANSMLTASYDSTTDVDSYFIKGMQTSSGNDSGVARQVYGYYLNQDISGTDTSSDSTDRSSGIFLDIDDTSVVSDPAPLHTTYGVYSNVNWAGTNTNNTALDNCGGYFTATGNMGTTGTTVHYGLKSLVSGTADNNYGLWVSSSGATTANYGIWVDKGNVILDDDSQLLYFGEAQDASITFDSNSLNINTTLITTTDDLEVTADDVLFSDTVGAMAKVSRGTTDTDITYLTLYNADGELCYIYPNADQNGIVVSSTAP